MVKCDIDYTDNWSLGWDVRIIGTTIVHCALTPAMKKVDSYRRE
jgi:hypothetical protein